MQCRINPILILSFRFLSAGMCLIFLAICLGCIPNSRGIENSVPVGESTPNLPSIPATENHSESKGKQSAASSSKGYSGIFFLDDLNGWALCRESLCETKDGGKNWRRVSGRKFESANIAFADERTGWIVENRWAAEKKMSVLKTTDGGKTWKSALVIPSPVYSFELSSKSKIVVSARWSPMEVTADGGTNWTKVQKVPESASDSEFGVGESVNYLKLLSEERAWGYGAGIWFSEDSGVTWSNVVSPDLTGNGLLRSAFPDNITGYLIGRNKQIWRMVDGKTWRKVKSRDFLPGIVDDDAVCTNISFVSPVEGWITCRASKTSETPNEKLLYTKDGGEGWEVVHESESMFSSIKFLGTRKGFAIDLFSTELLKTNDGGRTWSKVGLRAH